MRAPTLTWPTWRDPTLAALETVWPGVTPEWNGLATLSVPFLDPNVNGSYSYYRVGQYHTFGGYEGVRQRNVHFAGEHTSGEFQGFMEGAAAEGVRRRPGDPGRSPSRGAPAEGARSGEAGAPGRSPMSDGKLVSLAHAAALVADGDHITIGGVMLHRIPAAFVRELARQGRRGLRLSKPSPSYDLDLLCAGGVPRRGGRRRRVVRVGVRRGAARATVGLSRRDSSGSASSPAWA